MQEEERTKSKFGQMLFEQGNNGKAELFVGNDIFSRPFQASMCCAPATPHRSRAIKCCSFYLSGSFLPMYSRDQDLYLQLYYSVQSLTPPTITSLFPSRLSSPSFSVSFPGSHHRHSPPLPAPEAISPRLCLYTSSLCTPLDSLYFIRSCKIVQDCQGAGKKGGWEGDAGYAICTPRVCGLESWVKTQG